MGVPSYQFSQDGSLILHVQEGSSNTVEILQGSTGVKVGRIRIPFKSNATITAVSAVKPKAAYKTKKAKASHSIYIALSSGDVYEFSEEGRLLQSGKLDTSDQISTITSSYLATSHKIFNRLSKKTVTDKFDIRGFYEGEGELFISKKSSVLVLADKTLETKAELNLTPEPLIWGSSDYIVTAGNSLNIGHVNGQMKTISLSAPARAISCHFTEKKYLDIVVHRKTNRPVFFRVEIGKTDLKNATVTQKNWDEDMEAVVLTGTTIRGFSNGRTVELIYQDQVGRLSENLKFEVVGQPATGAAKQNVRSETVLLGAMNQTLPGAMYRLADVSKQIEAIPDDEEEEEVLLKQTGKNVPELQIIGALTRALQRGNYSNLERILEVSDEDLIVKTVKQLPNQYCMRFLEHVIELYANRAYSAKSCATLIAWIHAIFTVKATFFMGRRDILEIASPLFNTLDAKLSSLDSLLDLSGRLDLVLTMSGIDKHNTANVRKENKKITYEVDETDDMDVFIEQYKKGNIEEDEAFNIVDEDEQQDEEDKRDGSAYQNVRDWFPSANADDMSDDEVELEQALSAKEKEVFGSGDALEDDYEDDEDQPAATEEEAADDDESGDDEENAENGDDDEDEGMAEANSDEDSDE